MQCQKKNAQSAIIFLLESTVFYLRFEGRGWGRKRILWELLPARKFPSENLHITDIFLRMYCNAD